MSHSHCLSIDNLILGVFTNAERFTDDHPLKKQAVIVIDALESTTNGMENPDVDGLLEELPADSPFLPWRDLVHALKAFYRGELAKMAEHLEAIPASAPPKKLERLLLHLSGLVPAEGRFGRAEREIIGNIRANGGPMSDAVAQITEALDLESEEILADSVAYVARELYGKEPETAKRLALWALEHIGGREMGPSLIRGHLELIFGGLESRRLVALSLMDRDPEESLVFWLRYFVGYLSGPLPKPEDAAALCEICLHLADKSQSAGQGVSRAALPVELPALLETSFPGLIPKTADPSEPLRFFTALTEAFGVFVAGIEASSSSPKRKKERPASPVQLYLFS